LVKPEDVLAKMVYALELASGHARASPWAFAPRGMHTWARVEALQRNQAFIDQYHEARADHLAGREAIFPAGTWWLRRFAGCAELGATAPTS
jgi:hypothetical protein